MLEVELIGLGCGRSESRCINTSGLSKWLGAQVDIFLGEDLAGREVLEDRMMDKNQEFSVEC